MDVIVTGLPRSGLTVAAALIDYLPNAVCLNAPDWHVDFARECAGRPTAFCRRLVDDFAAIRTQLQNKIPIADHRAADGAPLLDHLFDARKPKETIRFTRPNLKENFILGMKHHGLYTGILPHLTESNHFKIIAVIRHPLDVIASWRRIGKHPIGEGRLPSAARFWPEAARLSDSKNPLLERMVQLYDAHIERYHELRGKIHIVKYEDIIHHPMLISKIMKTDEPSAAAALIEHRPKIRMQTEASELRDYFQQYGIFTKQYYPKI